MSPMHVALFILTTHLKSLYTPTVSASSTRPRIDGFRAAYTVGLIESDDKSRIEVSLLEE
jgi:hypothetical protein